jgi:hypothetical protein
MPALAGPRMYQDRKILHRRTFVDGDTHWYVWIVGKGLTRQRLFQCRSQILFNSCCTRLVRGSPCVQHETASAQDPTTYKAL